MKNFNNKINLTRGSLLFWVVPIIALIILFFLMDMVKDGVKKNNIGKPETVSSKSFGKIETILVKPGDYVKEGQEICTYIVMDKSGTKKSEKIDEKVTNVTTKIISGEKFIDSIELPGLVSPIIICNISPRIGGEIISFLVKEGDKVKKGDLIVKIDESDFIINLNRTKASFDLAKLQYERAINLTKARASSLSNEDSAKLNLQLAKAEYENSQLYLKRCSIYSPINGIIEKKFYEAGEIVEANKPILKIIDISKVKIRIGIPENDIQYMFDKKEVNFTVPAINNREYCGKINYISREPDQLARLYPLELIVENRDERLLPAMYVKAKIIKEIHENGIILPLFQIIPGDNEYYTFIKKGDFSKKRILKLGSFQGKKVNILSGLKLGDELIVKGLRLLSNDSPIRVIKEDN